MNPLLRRLTHLQSEAHRLDDYHVAQTFEFEIIYVRIKIGFKYMNAL